MSENADSRPTLPSTGMTLLRHGYATNRKEQPLLSSGITSISSVAKRVQNGPQTRQLTQAFRQNLERLGPKHGAVRQMKSKLPAVIPSLALPPGTPVRDLPDPIPHTGLYVYDMDQDLEPELLPSLLHSLAAFEHTLLAATSTSGNGLYAIVAGPLAESPLHHKLLWNALHEALPDHIRRHAAPGQNNVNRTRIIVNDPECYLAAKAPAMDVQAEPRPQRNAAPRPATATRHPRQNTRQPPVQSISEAHKHTELVRSALAALPASHADIYSSWIATAFRLAGGQHIHGPAFQGRRLFTEWSRSSPKYQPGDEAMFERALLEWDGRATTAGIIADARENGWRTPAHLIG